MNEFEDVKLEVGPWIVTVDINVTPCRFKSGEPTFDYTLIHIEENDCDYQWSIQDQDIPGNDDIFDAIMDYLEDLGY